MHIELRKLAISKTLSEETTAYTAEIWINGVKAFAASNHGHGGCDMYRQLGTVTEHQANTWLKANRTPRIFHGMTLEPDLENEVAKLMDAAEARKTLLGKIRRSIVTIEDDKVFSYPLKGHDRASMTAAILKRTPTATIVTTDEAMIARALALMPDADD